MTKYLVLRQITGEMGGEPSASWTNLTEVDATSAEHAIRTALAGPLNVKEGTYVAVPARSWKPVTVQAVQTTTIKLGEAT